MEKKLTKREKLLEKKTIQALELQKINEEIRLETEKEQKRTLLKINSFIKKIELLDKLTSSENLTAFLGGILKISKIIKYSDGNTPEYIELKSGFEIFEQQLKSKKLEEKVNENEE